MHFCSRCPRLGVQLVGTPVGTHQCFVPTSYLPSIRRQSLRFADRVVHLPVRYSFSSTPPLPVWSPTFRASSCLVSSGPSMGVHPRQQEAITVFIATRPSMMVTFSTSAVILSYISLRPASAGEGDARGFVAASALQLPHTASATCRSTHCRFLLSAVN